MERSTNDMCIRFWGLKQRPCLLESLAYCPVKLSQAPPSHLPQTRNKQTSALLPHYHVRGELQATLYGDRHR